MGNKGLLAVIAVILIGALAILFIQMSGTEGVKEIKTSSVITSTN